MDRERVHVPAGPRYRITPECNGCGVCVEWAPNNIVPSWDGSFCEIVQQPASPREEWDLHDAALACPLACLLLEGARSTALAGATTGRT